jgi:hypothetical protein
MGGRAGSTTGDHDAKIEILGQVSEPRLVEQGVQRGAVKKAKDGPELG